MNKIGIVFIAKLQDLDGIYRVIVQKAINEVTAYFGSKNVNFGDDNLPVGVIVCEVTEDDRKLIEDRIPSDLMCIWLNCTDETNVIVIP